MLLLCFVAVHIVDEPTPQGIGAHITLTQFSSAMLCLEFKKIFYLLKNLIIWDWLQVADLC